MDRTGNLPETILRDHELVARTRGGDRDAFRRIGKRDQTLVCSIACSRTRNLTRSEDIAQETFIAGWEGAAATPARCEPSTLNSHEHPRR